VFFYVKLTDIFDTSLGNVRIVFGNLNAKLSRKIDYKSCIGTHSLHTVRNDNGSKLIDFVVRKGLVNKNHFVPKKRYTQVYVGLSRWKL